MYRDYTNDLNKLKLLDSDSLVGGLTPSTQALRVSVNHPYSVVEFSTLNFFGGILPYKFHFLVPVLFLMASLLYLWLGLKRKETNSLIKGALIMHLIASILVVVGVIDVYFECGNGGGGFCGLLGQMASGFGGAYLFTTSLIVLIIGLWKLHSKNTAQISSS